MFKLVRRFLGVALTVSILISMLAPVAVQAAGVAEIAFGQVSAEAGERITVPVTITGNPGIASFRFRITYNNQVLSYVSIQKGSVIPNGTLNAKLQSQSNELVITWYDIKNATGDGVLFYLVFDVTDAEEGNYPLLVTYPPEDIVNASWQQVYCSVSDGWIAIHVWDDSITYDAQQHWFACTICGEKNGEEYHHGGVADCLNTAVCVDCGQAYGSVADHNLVFHDRIEADHHNHGQLACWSCDVCGKLFSDAQGLNEISQEDIVIEKIPHIYSEQWCHSATQHWKECSCGDKVDLLNHNYDDDRDTTCNICGYVRVINHSWNDFLSYDVNSHWIECSRCGDRKEIENHYGGVADCIQKAYCTACGQAYGNYGNHDLTHVSGLEADHYNAGHIEYWFCELCDKYFSDANALIEISFEEITIPVIPHDYSNEWNQNSNEHWYQCDCGHMTQVAVHSYDHSCDTTCNICGYLREINHSWNDTFFYDEFRHWQQCSVCDEIKDLQDHHGGSANCQNYATCTDCGQNYGEMGLHLLTHHSRVEANHYQIGHEEYWTCSMCGQYFSDMNGDVQISPDSVIISIIPHSYEIAYNAVGHWYQCSCGDCIQESDHIYDHACDSSCNFCNYYRQDIHVLISEWEKNDTHHWHVCELCGAIVNEEAHEMITDIECAICGPCGLSGDLTNDGLVNSKDVAYLLWHTLFPNSYPVNQNVDFTTDGIVNSKDVAYLLWHTLFPNSYPLP